MLTTASNIRLQNSLLSSFLPSLSSSLSIHFTQSSIRFERVYVFATLLLKWIETETIGSRGGDGGGGSRGATAGTKSKRKGSFMYITHSTQHSLLILSPFIVLCKLKPFFLPISPFEIISPFVT
jgi:hypothetical protein